MSQFFIRRPVFAWVIAIIIMLAGMLSISKLPVSQYPEIAPPSVSISASYPGASGEVVEQSVTQVIEQSMKGLDGMLYMSSSSQSDGTASITITFDNGTNSDIAQVQVQNKLQSAMPRLPQAVQQQGVTVNKASAGFLMVLGFVSDSDDMTNSSIADYIESNIVDPLSRINGVGNVRVFGSQHAMRIWLDPAAMLNHQITTEEVVAQINAQNAQVTLGELGGTPSVPGQEINATVVSQGRLQTPEQFGNIILKGDDAGSTLRLKDVARVEIGAESYNFLSRYNRNTAAGVAISLTSGANALETADDVKALVADFEDQLPESMKIVIPYDTTPFVKISIESVIHTLAEAVVLVFLVMLLFLQNLRATLIPTIAVPVVLLGTMGLLAALGFSINMLTMFALVLAIGLLVDDAIVVVENVERIMSEEGLSPLEATKKSMGQISSALVGIGLVLSAVFIPMAFMSGATGVIFRQFSATIVSAMALSVLVALVLTPALCATLLKPVAKGHGQARTGFFGWFNRRFEAASGRYRQGVKGIILRPVRFVAIYAVLAAIAGLAYVHLPSSFLPEEDQGMLLVQVQAPQGATQSRTMESIEKVEDYFLKTEADSVDAIFSVSGFSFAGSGQNMGIAFVKLKNWDERKSDDQNAQAIAARSMAALSQIKDAMVFTFAPPAIPALGTSNGFSMYLKDTGGNGRSALAEAEGQLLGLAAQSDALTGVRPNGMPDSPQLRVDINEDRAVALGLDIADINRTLSVAWGSSYIDDFIENGRVKRVYLQGEAEARMTPEDFSQWYVRNQQGDMVPFTSFASTSWQAGSPKLVRYNGSPAVEIQGAASAGHSSGEAMIEMEHLTEQLPKGFSLEWSGMSYQERSAGDQVFILYALSALVVFLCLAALYESWSVPTAVIMMAPLGILGTVAGAWLMGMSEDVYFQVAMLTTIGLTSKNAILIVEFAKSRFEAGQELVSATLSAVKDRIRPIVMTSMAFGLGVLPLALASGAGAGSQNAIGSGVLGGMIVGTFSGIFFIPLFYIIITRISQRLTSMSGDISREPPQSGDVA